MHLAINLVFPTRVGMNRVELGQHGLWLSIPHASGDEPTFLKGLSGTLKYSPREWG